MMTAVKQQLGMLDNRQALDQEEGIEDAEEEQKIVDFSVPIKKLAKEHLDFVQIMYDYGSTRIKIPGLLSTVGHVMTIPLGAQTMKINLNEIKQAFGNKGYKVIDK